MSRLFASLQKMNGKSWGKEGLLYFQKEKGTLIRGKVPKRGVGNPFQTMNSHNDFK